MTYASGGKIEGGFKWPCPDHGNQCEGVFDRAQVIQPNGTVMCEEFWMCAGIPDPTA
jgi:hypothetical protein